MVTQKAPQDSLIILIDAGVCWATGRAAKYSLCLTRTRQRWELSAAATRSAPPRGTDVGVRPYTICCKTLQRFSRRVRAFTLSSAWSWDMCGVSLIDHIEIIQGTRQNLRRTKEW